MEREKKKERERERGGRGRGRTVQAAFNNKRVERPNSIQEEEEGRDKTQSAVRG